MSPILPVTSSTTPSPSPTQATSLSPASASPIPAPAWSTTIAGIQPGASETFTTSYTLTQEDLDSNGGGDGDIDNTATANAVISTDPPEVITVEDSVAVPLVIEPGLELIKSGTFNDENGDGFAAPGETISYSFTVSNTGNITLSDVSISDPKVSPITPDSGDGDGDGDIDTLPVGTSASFSGSYTITADDIENGFVINEALASSTLPDGGSETGSSGEVTTELPPGVPSNPALTIDKVFTGVTGGNGNDVADFAGDILNYTVTITNTGDVPLPSIGVTDPRTGLGTTIAGIQPGASETFTTSYTLTQEDLDSNGGGDGDIDNTATAIAVISTDPLEAITVEDSVAVPLVIEPGLELIKAGSFNDENGDGLAAPGETISYSFTVSNTGNITLTGVSRR